MSTTKKRVNDVGGTARPAKKRTTTKATGATPRPAPRAAAPAARKVAKPAARPRIRTSHGGVPDAPASSAERRMKTLRADIRGAGEATSARREIKPRLPAAAAPRKAPLTGPKRAVPRKVVVPETPGPSTQARELALGLAAAGLDKKAIGVEILDVTGKVDYADFLVVMTGRSDRHVHAIATGIEEAMRAKKLAPLSMEGLTAASWVLIDFGDVVVHVFQEEARALYDIEGLWIDAGRVPVPVQEGASGPSSRGD